MEQKDWFYKDDKRHRRSLRGYRWGGRFKRFSINGLWFFSGEKWEIALRVIGHGVILLLVQALCQQWLLSLGIYLALHVLGWILFGILEKKSEKTLNQLQEQYKKLQQDYFDQQCQENGIQHGCIIFEDGLTVASGRILADMNADVGSLRIYQLDNIDEFSAWDNYKLNLPRGERLFIDQIASLELRKKFGIQTGHLGDAENLRYMKYFSPSLQLKMVKAKMQAFREIEISEYTLKAKTKETVASPARVNVFEKKKLSRYFLDVDRYCAEMQSMGQRVHEEFAQIAFLRG